MPILDRYSRLITNLVYTLKVGWGSKRTGGSERILNCLLANSKKVKKIELQK